MPATMTVLDREIADEERRVGLPTDEPLTDRAIAHRRLQIASVLFGCGFVALFAIAMSNGVVQMLAVALTGGFGIYAIEQDRHLRRLNKLHESSERITLVVAEELLCRHALDSRTDLLDARDAMARCAGSVAAALADVLPAACARVRLLGPSGEVPVAAECTVEPWAVPADDPLAALEALDVRGPVRDDGELQTVMVVPVWRANDIVALLEVVSPLDEHYEAIDTALVDAFARGAAAALVAREYAAPPWESSKASAR